MVVDAPAKMPLVAQVGCTEGLQSSLCYLNDVAETFVLVKALHKKLHVFVRGAA